jgi:hypothetical protein
MSYLASESYITTKVAGADLQIVNSGIIGQPYTTPWNFYSSVNGTDSGLDIWGNTAFDCTTVLRLFNSANAYGRTRLCMVGRYQYGNDGWSMEYGRNSIIFQMTNYMYQTPWAVAAIQEMAGSLGFLCGSDTPSITMLSGNGNVGIGTTYPYGRMHIYESYGTAPGALSGSLIIDHGNAGGVSSIVFPSRANFGSDRGYIAFYDNVSYYSSYSQYNYWNVGSYEAAALVIGCEDDPNNGYGGDSVIITPAGNIALTPRTGITYIAGQVGIGTVYPNAPLHVYQDLYYIQQNRNGVELQTNCGYTSGQYSLGINWYMNNYYGATWQTASINAYAGSSYGGRLIFSTSSSGSTGNPPNERMRITENGYVGIGTQTPGYPLQVSGLSKLDGILIGSNAIDYSATSASLAYKVAASYTHSFEVSGSNSLVYNGTALYPGTDNAVSLGTGSYRYSTVYAFSGVVNTSDESLKVWKPLTYGLSQVLQIEPIQFQWKQQLELPEEQIDKHFEYYGFRANQLQQILPELVYDEDPTVPLQLNYAELIPVLVKAIQEQNETIQTLQMKMQLVCAKLGL